MVADLEEQLDRLELEHAQALAAAQAAKAAQAREISYKVTSYKV